MSRIITAVPRAIARLSTRPVPSLAARRFYASGSHISNGDADIIELEKSRNLSKQQGKTSTPHEFAPGWNEHLASVSEAYVKADKATGALQDLQTKTVDYMKKRHSTTDPSTGKQIVDEVEETFERDTRTNCGGRFVVDPEMGTEGWLLGKGAFRQQQQ